MSYLLSAGLPRAALLVSVTIVGASCQPPDQRPATWPYIHAAIIVTNCATASCHSSLTQRAGVVLEDEDDAYDLLVGEQFVVPGNADSGLLFLLEGEERTPMPPDIPLPAADIELIRTWIVEGALRQ